MRYFFNFLFLSSLLLCLNIFSPCYTQQIIRSSLSSFGNSVTEDGLRYRSTVGQPSNTTQIKNGNIALRQGFQQPLNLDLEVSSKIFCAFEIYPNPVANHLAIYTNDFHNFKKIIIKDTQGRVCKIQNANFISEKEIDISGLANGIYFVSLNNEKINSCSKKLVVLK